MSSSCLSVLRLPLEIRNAIYEFWAAGYVEGCERIVVSHLLRYLPIRRRVHRAFYEAMR